MQIVTIDFETYYDRDYSLSKITTEEYLRDARFEVIGVAVKIGEAATYWVTGTHAEIRKSLNSIDWSDKAVLAHNTLFDGAILSWVFGVRPKVLLDTLCMARALHGVEVGGSLKALTERYALGQKGTEINNALGKRRRDFTAEELERYGEYCKNDVELTYALFKILAEKFPKQELKVIDATLRMFTEPVLELDVPLLTQHLQDVKERKENLLAAASADKDTLMSNDKFAELLKELGVNPPTKTSPRTQKLTWAFAKTDEEFKELLDHPDLRVQALVAARLGNKTTLEETRTQRFIDIGSRGSMPVPLRYYGAKTGRWSAEGSINLQNVPRGSKLKQAICAPHGYVLVGADLSNIELRVGLWLAGEMEQLNLLAAGKDLYKDFASKVFNTPYDSVTKDQRFVGKTSQLSLIYGTGAVKLQNAIKTMAGLDIGETEAKRIVDLYRTSYQKVKHAWSKGGEALEAIFNNTAYSFCHDNFAKVDGNKGLCLASGLWLQYPDLQKQLNESGNYEWSYSIRRGRDKVYGAKVFQGFTQATARCILAQHLLKINRRYRCVLSVHDALYALAPIEEADAALEFVLATMTEPLSWMPGLPLDAEGSYGRTLAEC